MDYKILGRSDLKISKICLGTMTFGEQNTEKEAFEQLDYATEMGINFIDTAEIYSVPTRKDTYGDTEKIIGNWMKTKNNRKDIILASKIAGPGMPYIRSGSRLTKKQILEAIDTSLARLQTNYIDLYQLHWPDRQTNFFERLDFKEPQNEQITEILESLEALGEIVKAGKVRYVGVSNETPWGLSKFLSYSQKFNLPRIVSNQNPYNLLNRSYEIGLAEFSYRSNVNLLAYSPLAFGALSGKYLNGKKPANARLTLYPEFNRYIKPTAAEATQKYLDVAKKFNLNLSQMVLAFVYSRGFIASSIIGATTMEQLKNNIDAGNLELSDEVIAEIEKIHLDNHNPVF